MGSHHYSIAEKDLALKYLATFDKVSVRESDSAQYLRKLLERPIEHVLDPTLLLSKNEWLSTLKLNKPFSQRPYILVYVLRKNRILSKTVNLVAKSLGMDVIIIDQDPFTTLKCNTHVRDAGPRDFVELFSNASFVITNSFHGTAFSVNFNVPFIVTPPPSGLNRIMSLLTAVGAESRVIKSEEEASKVICDPINFEEININLNALRTKSKSYIESSMREIFTNNENKILEEAR
ncbi:Polysaccharide pyruvyl transferase [compost metagenome]